MTWAIIVRAVGDVKNDGGRGLVRLAGASRISIARMRYLRCLGLQDIQVGEILGSTRGPLVANEVLTTQERDVVRIHAVGRPALPGLLEDETFRRRRTIGVSLRG